MEIRLFGLLLGLSKGGALQHKGYYCTKQSNIVNCVFKQALISEALISRLSSKECL